MRWPIESSHVLKSHGARQGMEMKSLTEKAIQEEALVRASLHTVQDLEKAEKFGMKFG